MHSNRYTILFALLICVSCSILLALAAGALKPAIDRNVKLDIQKNILLATGLIEDPKAHSLEALSGLYKTHIIEKVIDEKGNVIPDLVPEKPDPEIQKNLLPLYVRDDNGEPKAYCFPVSGKGLWSTIYGYLALQSDGSTVMGITFYKHGETPGLGGEIEREWFTANFKGKQIFNSKGELTPLKVCKGKIPAGLSREKVNYSVDGISGSTLTGNGLNIFLERDVKRYEPYLRKIRENQVSH